MVAGIVGEKFAGQPIVPDGARFERGVFRSCVVVFIARGHVGLLRALDRSAGGGASSSGRCGARPRGVPDQAR